MQLVPNDNSDSQLIFREYVRLSKSYRTQEPHWASDYGQNGRGILGKLLLRLLVQIQE
jgi:hypothetical protein